MPLSDAETRLCESIARRERALMEDLRLHVGLPTGMNNTPALDETRDRLCVRLCALGAAREDIPGDPRPDWLAWRSGPEQSQRTPPVAVCRRIAAGKPRILIAGHLDTVHDPWGAFRELSIAPDGKTATGPGCVDMKGGLVIALHALEALAERGESASWSFLMNSDEETGSYHSDRALRAEAARHDLGLALEPAMAGGGLALTRGGSGQFMIECHGKAAHVGRDFASGVSAVDALARAILTVHGFSDVAKGMCVNVGPLSGGIAPNVVADHARGWGNVRFPDSAAGEAITAALQGVGRGASGARVQVHTSFNRPAKTVTPGTQRLADAARAVAEDLGQKLPFGTTAGVCDGNNLQDAGLPTIDTLGVRGGGLHSPQEWIELPSLVERCQLLAVLISRIGQTWNG